MPTVRVGAGVIADGERLLICQRRATDRHPGKWEFPGGKMEAGETPAECVRRELREELDVEAVPGRELWQKAHDYGDRVIELVFVQVDRIDRPPRNLCFADIRWVDIADLSAYDFLDADREFIALLQSRQLSL